MSVIAEVFDAQWPNDMLSQMKSMRDSSALCDVMLVGSQGKEYLVHSTVLAAASEYFKDLLRERITPVFVLKTDVADELWPSLIEYLYSGQMELASDKLSSMKDVAEQFQMNSMSRSLVETESELSKIPVQLNHSEAQDYMDGLFPRRGDALNANADDYIAHGNEEDEQGKITFSFYNKPKAAKLHNLFKFIRSFQAIEVLVHV